MSNLEQALRYAERGFSVIPMIRKKPVIKFADRDPLTKEEITEIWTNKPHANIALKTDKFLVFDIDVHDGSANGIESFKKLNKKEWFQDTLCQRTASGGYHYFFKKPKDEYLTQIVGFLPGIDIKAHNNNYVLVAPSIVDSNLYKFLNKKPIKECPQGLLDMMKEKLNVDKNVDFSNSNYFSTGSNKTIELFDTIANGLGVTGGRNASLASFCGGLLFRGVHPQTVLALAKITNERTPDPLSDKEVVTTVESMIKKDLKRKGVPIIET